MTPDSQEPTEDHPLSRRAVLGAGVGVAAAAVLAACTRDGDRGSDIAAGQGSATTTATAGDQPSATATAATPTTTALTPTPECADADDLTPAQTEGPYFKTSSPEKANLYGDVNSGTRLVVTGAVVTTACQPVARALIDVWQADAAGSYDNSGYRLRGHLFSDSAGRYRFETVVPGFYPGRTRHIHVKVQSPNGPILTTQLYFPGEARNAGDGIYRQELDMALSNTAEGRAATFDFVVRS